MVLKDPSTTALAISGGETDVTGTGAPLAGRGGVETSGAAYWSGAGPVKRKKMASYLVCHPRD